MWIVERQPPPTLCPASHNAWPFPLASSVAPFSREQQQELLVPPESCGHGSHWAVPSLQPLCPHTALGSAAPSHKAARWAPDGTGTARHRLCPSTERMGALWNGAQAPSSRALSRAQLVACERLRFQSPGSELNIKLKILLERKFLPTMISVSSKYNFKKMLTQNTLICFRFLGEERKKWDTEKQEMAALDGPWFLFVRFS